MGAINFADWRLEERDATLSAKKNTTLIVDRATLGFEKIDQALNRSSLRSTSSNRLKSLTCWVLAPRSG
jgi:hypothetical protein